MTFNFNPQDSLDVQDKALGKLGQVAQQDLSRDLWDQLKKDSAQHTPTAQTDKNADFLTFETGSLYGKLDAGAEPIKDSLTNAGHRGHASEANSRYNETYKNAWQDGHISSSEERETESTHRNEGIASKQTENDDSRRKVGEVERHAAENGQISPREREQLNSSHENIETMVQALMDMSQHDHR